MVNYDVVAVVPSPFSDWVDPRDHPDLYGGITAKRLFAYAIDVVIVCALGGALWLGLGFLSLISFGILAPVKALLLTIAPLGYHALLTSGPHSATLGMRAMGIRALSLGPTAAGRGGRPEIYQTIIQIVGFYGSVACTGGLILALGFFNPSRRMLHDWISGVVVVNNRPIVLVNP